MAAITYLSRVARVVGPLCLVTFLSSAAAVSGQDRAPGPANDPEVQAAQRLFTAWMEGQLLNRDLPGVVVGVVAGDALVWSQGFGFADAAEQTAMTPQTKFRMASHSKLFTATAIMQLRDEGKLHLDDAVSKHLPWFTVKTTGDDDPGITIEELLSHGSGLPREADAHWTTYEFPTDEQLMALVAERQAAFAPGERWKYSNLAYTLAGKIVEAVSGRRWADYLQQHIFDPLDMDDSSVDLEVPGLAVGYGRRMPDGSRETMPFVDARSMAAATGLTSTVGDMARFVSAQFRTGARGGNRILGTGSLRQMHRVRMMETTWTRGNGIGFAVNRVGTRLFVGHGGGYPGYTTNTSIDLENRIGVIVLTNAGDSNPGAMTTQLMRTVGEAVAKATRRTPSTVAWDPSWSRFAGLYRGRGSDQHVVELHERLVILNPASATLDDPIELEPIGNSRFRYVAPVGGGPVGEVVRFVEENGRVVRMITGDSYVVRVRD